MSQFDPTQFLDTETTDQMDTTFTPVPVGEYPAMIKSVEARQIPSSKDPSELWTILDVTYAIDDHSVRDETGLPEPTIRQSIFLDINEEGKLSTEKGKNINLGRLREAVGLNEPGQVFSFASLAGTVCIIAVKHTPDKNDPENVYANVTKVAEMA